MAHYQNQYGAVPASKVKDPIQKEMDLSGDITGTGVGSGGTQVVADDYHDTTTTTDTTGVGIAAGAGEEGDDHHHHKKKGIIEKIKDKLPGTHHRNK